MEEGEDEDEGRERRVRTVGQRDRVDLEVGAPHVQLQTVWRLRHNLSTNTIGGFKRAMPPP